MRTLLLERRAKDPAERGLCGTVKKRAEILWREFANSNGPPKHDDILDMRLLGFLLCSPEIDNRAKFVRATIAGEDGSREPLLTR